MSGGLSHERKNFAEAETLGTVEGNMCGITMRDAVAPPRSKVPSRPKGARRNLRGLMSRHRLQTAMKPPNKAGRPAAEAVERRAEAKENANRCHTCRTQCRESVSQVPERVRKAARPAVKHPRWEPYAGKPHVRFYAGRAQ